jgi:hypothetical protein
MNKEDVLKIIFSRLQSSNIDYIVLRKHDLIPGNISCQNDIDILCKRNQRSVIEAIFRDFGFIYYIDSVENNCYLYGSYSHDHFENKNEDLHIDVVYSLAYRSTNAGEWVPAHKLLQDSIWKNRKKTGNFWVYMPDAKDELIHILCHCIFDKRKVSDYYADIICRRIKECDESELIYYLRLIFFKYSDNLVKKIKIGNVNDLYKDYVSFKDY